MKRKILFYVIAVSLLIGCSKPEANPAYPGKVMDEPDVEVEETLTAEEQDKIVKEFYNLLVENKDEDTITKFIDANISKLDIENADTVILEMEDYLIRKSSDLTHTYEIISKYKDYTSNEIKSYMDLLKLESENIYTDGENLNIGLEELLNRALYAEKHLREYSTGKTKKKVYDLYEAYIYGAILGSGNQYIYANEGTLIIKDEVLNIYKDFVAENEGTYVAKILSNYLEEIDLDQGNLNGENVIYFYENIIEIIRLNTK